MVFDMIVDKIDAESSVRPARGGVAKICQCNERKERRENAGCGIGRRRWRLCHKPPLFFGQQINAGRSCHSRAAAFDDTSARAIAAFAFWQSLVAPDFLLIGLSHKGHKGHKDNQFKNWQWHNSREGCPRRARSFRRFAGT